MSTRPFFGGVPTGPDVAKLVAEFGVPAEGQQFAHEEIERVLGLTRAVSRYHTITNAWRAHLLNRNNVDLAAVPGVGFAALGAEGRIGAGLRGVKSGVRKMLRSVKRADRAATDDPILLTTQQHMRRLAAAVVQEGNNTMKQIEMTRPAPQRPKVR